MVLKDRKQLAKLMVIQGVSGRQLAEVAGYKSHTYVQRLLKGEAKTLDPDPAVRIAAYFGVGIDDLFLGKVSTNAGRTDQPSRKAAA